MSILQVPWHNWRLLKKTEKIHAYERQYIMVRDVPNTFIQTNMPSNKDGEKRVIIKITGVLVDMLLELDSEMYSNHMAFLTGNKVMYAVVLRAIYVMFVALLLLNNNFSRFG